jgi:lipid-binding SYLF domain-containing protein
MLRTALVGAIITASIVSGTPSAIAADDKAEINRDSQAALSMLYASVPATKQLAAKATAILVFPKITKAGLGIGGQAGEGALIKSGTPVAYYKTGGGSFGLQAGVQTYGYAMFLMNDKAVQQLDAADGFEVGVGPSVVILDEGKAKQMTSTTMKDDIYAFVFGQKGLMAGIGIQGNKITKINPD